MSTLLNRVLTLHDSDGEHVYDVLASVCQSSGYDWKEVLLLSRRPDEALFYLSDSGCSCNSLTDNTPADLLPGHTIEDLLKHATSPVKRNQLRESLRLGEQMWLANVDEWHHDEVAP